MEPVVNIDNTPKKFQACFREADKERGSADGKIVNNAEASYLAESCCREDYNLCQSAHDYLRQQGYVLAENAWIRRSIKIETAPGEFQPYLKEGDRGPHFLKEESDGWISSDKELKEALEACDRAEDACDARAMAEYFIRIEEPVIEKRALRLFFTPGVALGHGVYYSRVPGVSEGEVDVPTHPDDIGIEGADAAGPVRTDEARSGAAAELFIEAGLDLWQYAFVKYKYAGGSQSCNMRRYANDYDAYTAVCFQRPLSHSVTLGFYPLSGSSAEVAYDDLEIVPWPLREEDFLPRTEKKYAGSLLGIEAGLVHSKFSQLAGWHRWGYLELDDSMERSVKLFGLSAGASINIIPESFPLGFELGLLTNIFPRAYFDVMLKLGVPISFRLTETE
jgi:hypothetical protein